MESASSLTTDKYIIIIPSFNEREKIKLLLRRFPSIYINHLLIVDDGSTDGTAEVLKGLGIRYLRHKVRMGVGRALKTGLKWAMQHQYKIAIIMAGNNKDDPTQIQRLLQPLLGNKADFVQGSRFLPGGNFGNMPFYRLIATRIIHPLLFSIISGKYKTDTTNGFRAFKLDILTHPTVCFFNIPYNSYELEILFYLKVVKSNFRCCEVPVSKIYPSKKLGITKIRPFIDWFKMLKPFLKLFFKI